MKHILMTFLLALACSASADVKLIWTVETSRVEPVAFECFHGETLDFEASFKSYGRPLDIAGKSARLYWQTNGMGSAWWSTNATIQTRTEHSSTNYLATATFTGEMDPGAPLVKCFIGFAGENYRAAFALKFRPSPGAVPNELPLPTKSIDFATVTVKNPDDAPFVVKGGAGVLTPGDVTNISSRVASNIVSVATNNLPEWTKSETKPTYTASEVGALPADTIISNISTNGTMIVGNLDVMTLEPAGYIPSEMTSAVTEYAPWKFYPDGGPDLAGTPSLYVTNPNYPEYGPAGWFAAIYELTETNKWTYVNGAAFMVFPSNITYNANPVWKKNDTLARHSGVVAMTNALATVAHTGSYDDLTGKPTIPAPYVPSPTDTTFSNATVAVVNDMANRSVTAAVDAAMTDILGSNWQTTYGGGLAGLIAALVAALTWLKNHRAGTFTATGIATPATTTNGVADVSTLFTGANTSLGSTIDAKLPYSKVTDSATDRAVYLYTVESASPTIAIPAVGSGITDFEVWLDATNYATDYEATFTGATILYKDGSALTFEKSAVTVVHFTACNGVAYTAASAVFKAIA